MKIVHIAQTHGYHVVGHKPTAEEFDKVVRSQFAVAQLILQNPNCPVVCESMNHTITFREFSQGKSVSFGPYELNVKKVQKIFPRGWPDKFDDLNRVQKEALYCGATILLLFLNIIPALYGSTDEISGKVGQHFFENDLRTAHENKVENAHFFQTASLIQSIREKAAIEAVKKAAAVHYKQVKEASIVILVYGSMHDFQTICTRNGFRHQKIYTHPLQITKYGKKVSYESTYFPDSPPYWNALDICEVSILDVDQINKQGQVEFSPQKIMIVSGLTLITVGSGLLAMYFLLPVANPLVLLVSGILLMGIGLAISFYLFADYLKDRFNPPAETIGVIILGKENPTFTLHKKSSLNAPQSILDKGTLFSSVDNDQLSPLPLANQNGLCELTYS